MLTAIGKLGGGYAEAVELIRRADRAQVLSARWSCDAIPAELNIRQLAQFARRDPTLAKANVEVAKAGVVRPELDANGLRPAGGGTGPGDAVHAAAAATAAQPRPRPHLRAEAARCPADRPGRRPGRRAVSGQAAVAVED